MKNTNIGLNNNEIDLNTSILEKILASEVVLNMKIRNYHWNIKAINFTDLHKFFEELYDESADNVDEIAERIRFLGIEVNGNYKNFLEKSILSEETGNNLPKETMIVNLLSDKERIISTLRDDIIEISEKTSDMGTEDFLTGLIQKHEKNAWMLRSMK